MHGHPAEYRLQVCKMFWPLANIMHVSVNWDGKPLLLLATARIAERNTASFQWEGGPPYDRQKIKKNWSIAALILTIVAVLVPESLRS